MGENIDTSDEVRERLVVRAVILISAITLVAVVAVLFSSAFGLCTAYCSWAPSFVRSDARDFSTYAATNLGMTIATAGLSAVVACLVLRLRDHNNDLVTPPPLTGPIVVVALGAALAFGAEIFAR